MPFNDELLQTPATRQDVAGVAIQASLAIDHILDALEAIKAGNDPAPSIKEVKKLSKDLTEAFDKLTGWRPNDDR